MTRFISTSAAVVAAIASSAFGTGLIPIARWDTVPYQRIDATHPLNVGVVAFSKEGIASVTFSVEPITSGLTYSGTLLPVTAMSLNPQTGVYEYWTTISSADFSGDGTFNVEATVVGQDDGIRDWDTPGTGLGLDPLPLPLVVNQTGELDQPIFWVAPWGYDGNSWDDEYGKSRENPMRSIGTAMRKLWDNYGQTDGGFILVEPGYTYTPAMSGSQPGIVGTTEWLTITTAPTTGPVGATIIEGYGGWPEVGANGVLVKFKGLTISSPAGHPEEDFTVTYGEDASLVSIWLDDCEIVGSGRYPSSQFENQEPGPFQPFNEFSEVYVTNTSFHDLKMAINGARLARNVRISTISDDAFHNVPMVVNGWVDDVDPWGGPWDTSHVPMPIVGNMPVETTSSTLMIMQSFTA